MQKHIIHKQRVVLELSRQEEAYNFQNKISSLFNNGLQTAIENVLDEIAPHNEVIRIDKLNLDLGIVSAQNFDTEFKNKLVTALKKAVTVGKAESTANGNVVVTAQPQSNREAVKYFLENGTLPWYSHIKNMQAWEKELFEQWKENDWLHIHRWLKTQQHTSPHVINRLIFQFSDAFLEHVLVQPVLTSTLSQTGTGGFAWPPLFNDVFVLARSVSLHGDSHVRTNVWKEVINRSFRNNLSAGVKVFITKLIISLLSNDAYASIPSHYQQLSQDIKTDVVKDNLLAIKRAAEYQIPLKKLADWENALQVIKQTVHRNEIALNEIHKSPIENDGESATGETESRMNDNEAVEVNGTNKEKALPKNVQPVVKKIGSGKEEEVSYVNNCGIVLLHPFLLNYFTDLGLLHEKRFIDAVAQQRAVLLLYYLATGETVAAEFNLGLQKILCGFPPEEALEASIGLSEKETEESANLLRAVIDYWPPLKNTSIKGFQITFLQRDGRISTTNEGKLLRVEQKAVDVLLGKLPWGYSTIRLPWMQEMLNVEWG